MYNIFIHDISSKFNTDIFPIYINKLDVVEKDKKSLLSQYSLEVIMHDIIKDSKYRTDNINNADIVYFPVYTFLLAWSTEPYVYNVNNIVNKLQELIPLFEWYTSLNKKILLTYADVLFDDSRTFLHHLHQLNNVYILCYENISKMQIPVPYVTHINYKTNLHIMPEFKIKKNLISYAGRDRNELTYCKDIVLFNTDSYNTTGQWISYNDINIYNKIDELYLNSYFSLQPHGDRMSRKGFYHSILRGCIPVVFYNNYKIYNEIFKKYVDIKDICVIIESDQLLLINDILNDTKDRIPNMLKSIERIIPLLLYKDDSILAHIFSSIT